MISPAKINFGLKILGKRPDGFHDLESIFLKLNWGDEIYFYPNSTGKITLTSQNEIANNSYSLFEEVSERGDFTKNILFKAYEKAKDLDIEIPGVEVHLVKRIPVGGGLGGGSTNAASLLRFIFSHSHYELSDPLLKVAKAIGSDVPFFLFDEHAHVSGLGDIISPVNIASGFGVLVTPDFSIPTKESYISLNMTLQNTWGVKTWNFLGKDDVFNLEQGNWSLLKNKFINDFEKFAFKTYPKLSVLKENLYKAGCSYVSMTGTGSCFFGFTNDLDTLLEVQNTFSEIYPDHKIFHFNF